MKKKRNDRLLMLLSFLESDLYVLAVLFVTLVVLGVLGVTVNWPTAIIGAVLFVVLLLLMRIIIIPRLLKPVTGKEGLIDSRGKVVRQLTPTGIVMIEGERWSAESINGEIAIGEEVEVRRVEGLKLMVRRLKKE